MEKENTPHGRAAAGDATVREGRHGAGALPPCWWNGPTHSLVRIGEINCGKGRENWSDQTRPTSERGPPALLSESVDRSKDQAGLGMLACEITQQMKVLGDPRTKWIVLQQEGHVAEHEE
jgi:hypothetical protein